MRCKTTFDMSLASLRSPHMRSIMICVTGFLHSQERCDVSHVSPSEPQWATATTGRKSEVVECNALSATRVSRTHRLIASQLKFKANRIQCVTGIVFRLVLSSIYYKLLLNFVWHQCERCLRVCSSKLCSYLERRQTLNCTWFGVFSQKSAKQLILSVV